MQKLRTDLVHAWRSLVRRPSYFAACAGTLALVLAANAAIFATVNATLLRPLPFTAGDRVVQLFMLPPGLTETFQRNPLQQMDVVRFRERTRTLRRLEGFLRAERVIVESGQPGTIDAAYVTPGLLEMLGASMAEGRAFRKEEEAPGQNVAVITEAYRRRAFAGREALGQTLSIDGTSYTVVGVTAGAFPPVFLDADVFTPLWPNPEPLGRNPARSVVSVAELADGATVEQANTEAAAIVQQLSKEFPRLIDGWTGGAQPFRQWQYGNVRAPILILFAATSLVLLIACGNIVNLTSAQAASRAADLALRVALGASRADVFRLQVAELLVISLAGIVPGLLLATLAVPSLLALDEVAARALGTVSIDWRVQLFTVVVALVAALGSAILPAMQVLGGGPASTLAEGSRRAAGSVRARRASRLLVSVEVALCLALLMLGGVLLASLRGALQRNPGFNPSGVLTAQVRVLAGPYPTTETRAAVVARILERIREIPGVELASTTMNDFIPGNAYQTMFRVDGRPTPDGQPHATQFRRVSPDYFRVMQIREIRGRTFSPQDTLQSPHVAVISQRLAERLFPGEDPVGRTIRRTAANAPPTTIIGVVDDVNDVSVTQEAEPTLYVAWAQNSANGVPVSFVVRTSMDPMSLVGPIRSAVLEVDPAMPLRRVQMLETFMADSIAPERFRTTVLGIIAILGLTLAAVGIFGVAYRSIVERRHEFAVRVALGSSHGGVVRMVVNESMRDVAIGAIGGLVAGTWASVTAARFLSASQAGGIMTAGGALVILAAVAVAAAVIPALLVLRVEPAEALRR